MSIINAVKLESLTYKRKRLPIVSHSESQAQPRISKWTSSLQKEVRVRKYGAKSKVDDQVLT